MLQRCGTYFTLFGVATAFGVAGTSQSQCLSFEPISHHPLRLVHLSYGLWRIRSREIYWQRVCKLISALSSSHLFRMFNLILTKDPVNWPWSAYINLPLIPLSLILSRFQKATTSLVIPLLISWPPSPPVGEPARRLYEFWSKPENAQKFREFSVLSSIRPANSSLWPPSPILFGLFGVPIVKALYGRAYTWAYQKLLNASILNEPGGVVRFNEGPLVIRILANVNGDEGQGHDGLGNGQLDAVADDAEAEGDAAVAQAAEQHIEVNATSVGRKVGGALLIPAISSMMGSLLFRLSKRFYLLRIFLGIKGQGASQRQGRGWVGAMLLGNYSGPGSEPKKSISNEAFSRSSSTANVQFPYLPLSWSRSVAFSPFGDNKSTWSNLSRFEQMKVGLQVMVNAFLGGSKMWVESDPVW